MEEIINGKKLELTNLDKIFWPEEGLTKGDLIAYYKKIAPVILPYLKDRPESLNRFPNGIHGENFYQKNVSSKIPRWIKTRAIRHESEDRLVNYILCQDQATLVYMANLGCIEINPWNSRTQKMDHPDYLILDIDPEGLPFSAVVDAALATKEVLDELSLEAYCKTSGATGIHIFLPTGAQYNYAQIREFAKIINILVHKKIPRITSLERSPGKRRKKIYLDYLQNAKGQTLASAYSVRPVKGALISTPLRWEEVNGDLRPDRFTMKNIFERIESVGDAWKGILGTGINIEKTLGKIEQISRRFF